MKRILVPTDFSPTSEKAFIVALDLATKNTATVILYHVYLPVESVFVDTEIKREEYNIQTEALLLKRLLRFKKKAAANFPNVAVSTILGRTPVIKNILAFAARNHIDLIVMGTQGASGLKKVIIGSVASRIAQKTELPLLLVPEKYEWKEPSHIIYFTKCLASDSRALQRVLPFAKLYNAAVTVAHIFDENTLDEQKEEKDFHRYSSELQHAFKDFKFQFKLVKSASLTQTMENLHTEIPYDMVAMLRRKKTAIERFFVESFTKNMAYVSSRLLFILPEE